MAAPDADIKRADDASPPSPLMTPVVPPAIAALAPVGDDGAAYSGDGDGTPDNNDNGGGMLSAEKAAL